MYSETNMPRVQIPNERRKYYINQFIKFLDRAEYNAFALNDIQKLIDSINAQLKAAEKL